MDSLERLRPFFYFLGAHFESAAAIFGLFLSRVAICAAVVTLTPFALRHEIYAAPAAGLGATLDAALDAAVDGATFLIIVPALGFIPAGRFPPSNPRPNEGRSGAHLSRAACCAAESVGRALRGEGGLAGLAGVPVGRTRF